MQLRLLPTFGCRALRQRRSLRFLLLGLNELLDLVCRLKLLTRTWIVEPAIRCGEYELVLAVDAHPLWGAWERHLLSRRRHTRHLVAGPIEARIAGIQCERSRRRRSHARNLFAARVETLVAWVQREAIGALRWRVGLRNL